MTDHWSDLEIGGPVISMAEVKRVTATLKRKGVPVVDRWQRSIRGPRKAQRRWYELHAERLAAAEAWQ